MQISAKSLLKGPEKLIRPSDILKAHAERRARVARWAHEQDHIEYPSDEPITETTSPHLGLKQTQTVCAIMLIYQKCWYNNK